MPAAIPAPARIATLTYVASSGPAQPVGSPREVVPSGAPQNLAATTLPDAIREGAALIGCSDTSPPTGAILQAGTGFALLGTALAGATDGLDLDAPSPRANLEFSDPAPGVSALVSARQYVAFDGTTRANPRSIFDLAASA